MRRASYVMGLAVAVGLGAIAVAQQAGQGGTPAGGARATGPDASPPSLPLDRWQPKRLPALPSGMTNAMIVAGDSLYRGKAGCNTCHGPDGYGMNNAGSGITMGLNWIPAEWTSIDSLITAGLPENLTRSSVAMPAKGVSGNLTPDETRQVAAYVWAIAHVAGEPWPGGHTTHAAGGATAAAAPAKKGP